MIPTVSFFGTPWVLGRSKLRPFNPHAKNDQQHQPPIQLKPPQPSQHLKVVKAVSAVSSDGTGPLGTMRQKEQMDRPGAGRRGLRLYSQNPVRGLAAESSLAPSSLRPSANTNP